MSEKDTFIPLIPGYSESLEDRFKVILGHAHFLSHAMAVDTETKVPATACKDILDYTDGVMVEELEHHTNEVVKAVESQSRSFAESEKLRTLRIVSQHFLDDTEGDFMTPQQYMKQHNLDGSFRPQLREAFYEVTTAAKQAVVEEIRQDDAPSLLEFPIDADAISLAIAATVDKNLEFVEGAAEKLRIETPVVPEVKLSKEERREYSGQKIYMGKLLLKKARTTEEFDQRSRNMQNLLGALKQYQNSYNETGVDVANHYNPHVGLYIEDVLMGHYIAIVKSARDQLAQDLIDAYDRIAKQGIQYKPQEKSPESSFVTDKNIPELTPTVESTQDSIREIDIIESPFPWSNAELDVTLHTNSENSLLFCEAQSDSALKISEKLRKKTPRNAKSFNRMRDQICKIELSDPVGKKPYIETINDVRNPDLADATVVYYGNTTPNAKRIYYVKTNCAQYPEFAKIAAENGLAEDTPIIVLIAETDKANQLRTYAQEFGMKRSHSKAKNVGAT